MKFTHTALVAAAVGLAGPALAADPESCATITMSDPGWSDITSTNALASAVLSGLGYEADIKSLSVPIGYEALKSGDLDVFLGNWMPAQTAFREDLDASGQVEELGQNLTGAKFTLAVPSYVSDAGVTDFADLAAYGDEFDQQIYGIESGAPANANIQRMIDADDFGLGEWDVVESGEQAMLAQVTRAERGEDWIVFLAWAPHPMNVVHDLTYLSGGDEYFGPNFGGAEVYTLARKDWVAECPNAAQFFGNLTFTVEMENEMMGMLEDASPSDAAQEWLTAHPDVLGPWLEGVTTLGGEPGLEAVKASLGL
jgi:glycine betaine/proline transport system substrate-binding protein